MIEILRSFCTAGGYSVCMSRPGLRRAWRAATVETLLHG